MNERARKAKTPKNRGDDSKNIDSETTHIDNTPEPVHLRPGEPDDNDGRNSTGPDAVQGLLPPASLDGIPSEFITDPAGGAGPSPQPGPPPGGLIVTPEERFQALELIIKNHQENIEAQNRTINNLIQELQARNGLAPSSTGTPPSGTWKGILEQGLGVIGNALQKMNIGGGGSNDLQTQLIVRSLRAMDEANEMATVMKMGMAKQLGIELAPKATHMTVLPHG